MNNDIDQIGLYRVGVLSLQGFNAELAGSFYHGVTVLELRHLLSRVYAVQGSPLQIYRLNRYATRVQPQGQRQRARLVLLSIGGVLLGWLVSLI